MASARVELELVWRERGLADEGDHEERELQARLKVVSNDGEDGIRAGEATGKRKREEGVAVVELKEEDEFLMEMNVNPLLGDTADACLLQRRFTVEEIEEGMHAHARSGSLSLGVSSVRLVESSYVYCDARTNAVTELRRPDGRAPESVLASVITQQPPKPKDRVLHPRRVIYPKTQQQQQQQQRGVPVATLRQQIQQHGKKKGYTNEGTKLKQSNAHIFYAHAQGATPAARATSSAGAASRPLPAGAYHNPTERAAADAEKAKRRPNKWTNEEDAALLMGLRRFKTNFIQIIEAYEILSKNGRSTAALASRYQVRLS